MENAHITFETAPDKVAQRIRKMRPSAVRNLFAAVGRSDIISLAGGTPDVSLAFNEAAAATPDDVKLTVT